MQKCEKIKKVVGAWLRETAAAGCGTLIPMILNLIIITIYVNTDTVIYYITFYHP